MSRTRYVFRVMVESDQPQDMVRSLLDNLINIGLEDARTTLENNENDTRFAQMAVDAIWYGPQPE